MSSLKIKLVKKKPTLKMLPLRLDLLKELDSLPKSTSQTYKYSLLKLAKDVFNKDYFDVHTFLANEMKIIDYIEPLPNGTRRVHLSALFKAYHILNIPDESFSKLLQCWNDWKEINKEVTEEESKLMKDWTLSKIDSIWRENKAKVLMYPYNIDFYTYYLIVSLYSLYPPLRQVEWTNSEIVKWSIMNTSELKNNILAYGNQSKNVFCLNNKKLILSSHKNKKGVRILHIPPILWDIIDNYHRLFGAKYVVCVMSNMNKSMGNDQVTNILNSIFGFSVDKLRALYTSEMCPFLTVTERNRLAQLMGHASSTQQLTYKRLPAPNVEDIERVNYLKDILKKTYD